MCNRGGAAGRGSSVYCYTGVSKVSSKGRDAFWEFMDLDKDYDTINRYDMWQML